MQSLLKLWPLLRKIVGIGAIAGGGAIIKDVYRGKVIEDLTNSSNLNESEPLIRRTYDRISPSLLQTHELTVVSNAQISYPYSVDSLWHKHILLVMPGFLLKPFCETHSATITAFTAHEAAHTQLSHSIVKDFASIGFAALTMQTLMGKAYRLPIIGFCGLVSYQLSRNIISRQCELAADDMAISRVVESKARLESFCRFEAANHPDGNGALSRSVHFFFSDHPRWDQRLAALRNSKNWNHAIANVANRLKRKLMMLGYTYLDVQPDSQYQHPIMRDYYQNKLELNTEEQTLVKLGRSSAGIFLDEKASEMLHDFYHAMQNHNSPLGHLYQKMSYEEFIARICSKRFASAYLNGNLLSARNQDDKLSKVQNNQVFNVKRNLEILSQIGTEQDTLALYQEYLSLDEIAISSLILTQAVMMPIGDGRRERMPDVQDLTWDVNDSLQQSIGRPITIADPAGIEFRDGETMHFDLFMVARPKNSNAYWEQRAAIINHSPIMAIAHQYYGDTLALNVSAEECKTNPNFITVEDKSGQVWYVCRSAYIAKTKQSLRQLLLAADQHMQEYQLGTAYNLKGLGLGAFGFSSASPQLETLYTEALCEVLSETPLETIRQINLLNFPTDLNKLETSDPSVLNQGRVDDWKKIAGISIKRGYGYSMSAEIEGSGNVGGTHSCGDSATLFGNEFHTKIPPMSSDEAAIAHQVLDPLALSPEYNPALLQHIELCGVTSTQMLKK